MSDNNSIYEITQLMKNPESLNKDMVTAFNLVGNHFRNKYIDPLRLAVEDHSRLCSHNPSQEIVFLQACKPFISPGGAPIFQQILNIFNTYEVIQNISREYNKNFITTSDIKDSAIHPDGVYEVDKTCLKSSSVNPIPLETDFLFIALAFILLFAKR